MYECVMGMRKHEGQGCILADEMCVIITFPCTPPANCVLGVWARPFR